MATQEKKYEMVDHPDHYNLNSPEIILKIRTGFLRFKIECIDVIRNMPFWKGSAIKYIWRAGLKPDSSLSLIEKEIEDCNKAIWYIKDHVNELEKQLHQQK